MADTENKNKNTILIILGIAVGAIVLYMVLKPKEAEQTAELPPLPPVDPCLKPDGTRLPDWICGAVSLINPLAKAGVAIYGTQTAFDLEKEKLRRAALT